MLLQFILYHQATADPVQPVPSLLDFFLCARFNPSAQEANCERPENPRFTYKGASPAYGVEWVEGIATLRRACSLWRHVHLGLTQALSPRVDKVAACKLRWGGVTSKQLHDILISAQTDATAEKASYLPNTLMQFGCQMEKVPGDGECLFFALRSALLGLPPDSEVTRSHPFFQASTLQPKDGESSGRFTTRHLSVKHTTHICLVKFASYFAFGSHHLFFFFC